MCGCERGQRLWGGCRKAEHVNAHMFAPERGREGHTVGKQASNCTVTELHRGTEPSYGGILQEQKFKHLMSLSFAHGRSPAFHCPCKVCYRTHFFPQDPLKWGLIVVKICLDLYNRYTSQRRHSSCASSGPHSVTLCSWLWGWDPPSLRSEFLPLERQHKLFRPIFLGSHIYVNKLNQVIACSLTPMSMKALHM